MRKLVYYVAVTVDGFIARADGSLDGFSWDAEFGARLGELFPETFPTHLREPLGIQGPNRRFDTVLMGRKTFEVALAEGISNPYPHLTQVLFSRSLAESPHGEVLLERDPVQTTRELKKAAGRDIWLCGGADLATALHHQGLIDTLIVKVNPVVFGTGIPLFTEDFGASTLKLTSHEVFASGHALLEYEVRQQEGPKPPSAGA